MPAGAETIRKEGPSSAELPSPWSKADLSCLIENNIGTTVMDPDVYHRVFGHKGQHFIPEKCDPIQLVWVNVKDKRQLLIPDGHIRARGILDHYETIKEKYPDFAIPYREITTLYTELPTPKGEKPIISLQKYLQVVGYSTKKHKEIRLRRTAALVMQYWDGIAAKSLTDTLPALGALNLLTDATVLTGSKEEVGTYLQTPGRVADNLFGPEANIDALLALREFVTVDMELHPLSVTRDALDRVITTNKSPQEVKAQILGLLQLPVVQAKIREAAGSEETAKQLKNFHATLSSVLKKLPSEISYSRFGRVESLRLALEHPQISFAQITDIITHEYPMLRYSELSKEKNAPEVPTPVATPDLAIEDLRRALRERDEALNALQTRLEEEAGARTSAENRADDLARKLALVTQLPEELAHAKPIISGLQEEVHRLANINKNLNRTVQEREAQQAGLIAAAKKIKAADDKTIKKLQSDLATAQDKIEKLEEAEKKGESSQLLIPHSDQLFVKDWIMYGNCKDVDPDKLHVQGAEQNQAKKICAGCRVKDMCLAFALKSKETGVWGGKTDHERRMMLKEEPKEVAVFIERVEKQARETRRQ